MQLNQQQQIRQSNYKQTGALGLCMQATYFVIYLKEEGLKYSIKLHSKLNHMQN